MDLEMKIKYKKGTPYPSHEYIKDAFNFKSLNGRKYCVLAHGANLTTHWKHRFKGKLVNNDILKSYGL